MEVNAPRRECPSSGRDASIINDTTSLQRTCHSTQSSHGGCKLLQILAPTKGRSPRYFAQKMGKLVNQTLSPMGQQKGNTIFTARSDPAAAIRPEHTEGRAEESENPTSME